MNFSGFYNLLERNPLSLPIHIFMRNWENIFREMVWTASRSSGKGGQNVNKVSTRITVHWNYGESEFFNDDEKTRIAVKMTSRISKEGLLFADCQETRSQLKNKELLENKLRRWIEKALLVPKKRKPVKVSKAAKEKRKEQKQNRSLLKLTRKKPGADF